MKMRAFNKVINSCVSGRGKNKCLDLAKLKALPVETKREPGMFIVCGSAHRGPLLVELAEHLDRSWLASMGYFHTTTNNGYTFLHTAEYPPNRGY